MLSVCLFTDVSPNKHDRVVTDRDQVAKVNHRDFVMITFRSSAFRQQARTFASISASSSIGLDSVGPYQIFDRNAKRMQKDRTALVEGGRRSRTVDYVRDEVAERMLERFLVWIHELLTF